MITIIAELATNHGGNLDLAELMIEEAVKAGADIVKTQGYQIAHLKLADAQYPWLRQCELSDKAHKRLMKKATSCGVRYMSTAFCLDDAKRLVKLGVMRIKVGSGEGARLAREIHQATHGPRRLFVSLPWGETPAPCVMEAACVFATVPLYPMPPECYSRVTRCEGWSDHAVGLDIAKLAMAQGCTIIEKHFSLPGQGRNQAWDATPDDLRELRRWANAVTVATTGTRYTGRWTA